MACTPPPPTPPAWGGAGHKIFEKVFAGGEGSHNTSIKSIFGTVK